jgi:hypothetical protein
MPETLEALELERTKLRAYYHCEECKDGRVIPKDRELDISRRRSVREYVA